MTRLETKTLLGLIVTAYPGSKIAADDRTVDLWFEMLADLETPRLALSAKALIATHTFPPSIAEVRAEYFRAESDARGDMSAGDALEKLRRSFRLYGYYKPTEARAFLGEQIWRVVTMVGGSYVDLCMCEDPNWPARFLHLYAAQAENDQRQLQIPAQVREHLMALGAGRVVKQIGGAVDG